MLYSGLRRMEKPKQVTCASTYNLDKTKISVVAVSVGNTQTLVEEHALQYG